MSNQTQRNYTIDVDLTRMMSVTLHKPACCGSLWCIAWFSCIDEEPARPQSNVYRGAWLVFTFTSVTFDKKENRRQKQLFTVSSNGVAHVIYYTRPSLISRIDARTDADAFGPPVTESLFIQS